MRPILCLLVLLVCAPFAHAKESVCNATPETRDLILDLLKGANIALARVKDSSHDRNGLWDKEFLRTHDRQAQKLNAFRLRRIANSVRTIVLTNFTPEKLHDHLIKSGFRHKRLPLSIFCNSKNVFVLNDGGTTENPKHLRIVPHDFYLHADGGFVRVKPQGIAAASCNARRRQPHASKGVVLDATITCTDAARKNCDWNSSFENEAFKISANGVALPKAPTKDAGFLPLHQDKLVSASKNPFQLQAQNEGYTNMLMALAHADLVVDYSSCSNKSKQPKTVEQPKPSNVTKISR